MIMLDSSFLIAYHNTSDKNHKQASELMPRIASGEYGRVNITDYIFDETATYLAAKQGLSKAIAVGTYTLQASELIGITKEDFDAAWSLFKSQRNTHLSFTDCTIIVAMRSNSITKLATFDGDFRKLSDLSVVS